jgi:hypothetical protein
LLNALSGELSQEKLEWLSKQFDALAQDRADALSFFVLHNVCQRLACAMEGESVSIDRFVELTAGIADKIETILRELEKGSSDLSNWDGLIHLLFRNLALYQA